MWRSVAAVAVEVGMHRTWRWLLPVVTIAWPIEAAAEGAPPAQGDAALKHGLEAGVHGSLEDGMSSTVFAGADAGYRLMDFLYLGATFSDGRCLGSSCRPLRGDVCSGCTYTTATEGSAVADGSLPLSVVFKGLRRSNVVPVLWGELGLGLRNVGFYDARIGRNANELNGIFSAELGLSVALSHRVLAGVYGGVTVTDISSENFGSEVFPTDNSGAVFGTLGARLSWIFWTIE
jgi:hypothetical protein